MQVLAGVVQVHDLGGLGELAVAMFQIQAAPSPRMVSWRTWSAPRRMPSASTRSAEHGGGLEGGDVAGGVPVPDRVAVVIELVLGEEDGELDLAGAGAAVLALAVPSGGLLRGHGDAGAVDRRRRACPAAGTAAAAPACGR